MIFDIEISPEAQKDLSDIYEYISCGLLAPQAAAGQLQHLVQKISSLNTNPKRYRAFDDESWKKLNLRIMPVDKYVVLYTVDLRAKQVSVIRVMFCARDLHKHLPSD